MILYFKDLQQISGRKTGAAVTKFLQEKGISYMLNADKKPFTTETRLNEAMDRGRRTEPIWNIGNRT